MNELFQKSFQGSTLDTRQRLRSRQTKSNQEGLISLLDQKGIEKWINEMLKEACLDVNNLSKMGLDRNSLKSAGIKDEDINRLYRCLFVYTYGFYQMLHEIIKNYQLTASIWKVFGILLEHTAKGDFQLTINQIQKESQIKVDELNQTLTQREKQLKQSEITSFDQINQLKQIQADLKDQNDALRKQRDNVELDFQQSNVAFEEEVALRIKFEYRINEIMSVYNELSQKYTVLINETNELHDLYDKTSKELVNHRKTIEQFKIQNDKKDMEILNCKQFLENDRKMIEEKDLRLQLYLQKIEQLTKNSLNDQSMSMSYEHQYNQICMQFSKFKEDTIHNMQELERYQRNYQELQQKDSQLINDVQIMKTKIFNLETENHKYKLQVESFDKLEQGYRSSMLHLQQENRDMEQNHDNKIKQFKKMEVEYSFATQRIQVQQAEIVALNQNVQQMKNAKIHLDDLFIKEKAKVQLLQSNLEAKEESINDLEKCLSFTQQRLHTVTMELNDIENKLRNTLLENTTTEIGYKKKIEQLVETIDNQRQEIINEKDKFEALSDQFDSQKRELSEIKSLYKVQVFENNNLVTKQIFSDRVINNDNQRIGEFINEISDMKISYENMQRKCRQLEIRCNEQDKIVQTERDFIIERYENKIRDYKSMQKEMISKMKLEDIISQWDRTNQNYIKLKQQYQSIITENQQLKTNLENSQNQLQQQNTQIEQLVSQQQNINKTNEYLLQKKKQYQLNYLITSTKLNEQQMQCEDQIQTLQKLQQQLQQITQNNEELKEENIKQKQMIKRYRLQTQGISQIQDSKSQIEQAPTIATLTQSKIIRDQQQKQESSFTLQELKSSLKKEKGIDIDLNSLSNSQHQEQKLQLQIGNQEQQQSFQFPKKLDSLQIKEELLKISITTNKQNERQTPLLQSRSISMSSKSQRSNRSNSFQAELKSKRNTVNNKNGKMNSRQFVKLFQITSERYQS